MTRGVLEGKGKRERRERTLKLNSSSWKSKGMRHILGEVAKWMSQPLLIKYLSITPIPTLEHAQMHPLTFFGQKSETWRARRRRWR